MSGIGRESERMSLIVEDLLLLARLDEGRPLEREPVDVAEVVDEAVETARTVEPERPIELTAEPAVVLGDRERLRQVVDNLLGNVRAHTPAGAPRACASRAATAGARSSSRTPAPASPPRSSSACSSASSAPTRRGRARAAASVSGLSIVSAVAAAHGGSVTARSEPTAAPRSRSRCRSRRAPAPRSLRAEIAYFGSKKSAWTVVLPTFSVACSSASRHTAGPFAGENEPQPDRTKAHNGQPGASPSAE